MADIDYPDVLDWLLSDDTGRSSLTILVVMCGRPLAHQSPPSDNSDFGRCYRLLQRFPDWKPRMPEVAARYPAWEPLVQVWDELTRIYEANKTSPQLYAKLNVLNRVTHRRPR